MSKTYLSATAKTMPASVIGSISPENLGRVISKRASATLQKKLKSEQMIANKISHVKSPK